MEQKTKQRDYLCRARPQAKPCVQQQQLRDRFQQAVAEYHEAVRQRGNVARNASLEHAMALVHTTHTRCTVAQKNLQKHISEHGCPPVAVTNPKSATHKALSDLRH
ncbi:MAG: hypothetical protein L0Z53_18790 [Acidobacteriales bacterium]|nr:hypothetical protein [Terriglobales bacterium]